MPRLEFHPEKIPDMQAFLKLCPFGALSEKDGKVEASAACKMCQLCVKKGPEGAALYIEDEKKPTIDKSEWNGVAVYVDHEGETIHPVTFELIGKARELAKKSGQPVRAVFIGQGIGESAKELLHYGIDEVLVYADPALRDSIPELSTAVMEDCVKKTKPCAILVGATTTGRELAPRIAARFRTGLTADCTILDMTEEGDLIQIRPAFGGNIMAQIVTPNHRPQMATVRYKVMNAPERAEEETGRIVPCPIDPALLRTTTEILSISPKEKVRTIESADVIVAVGRGLHRTQDGVEFRQFHLADAFQLVVNLLLLHFQLFAVGHILPFATTTYSKVSAHRFHPHVTVFDKPHNLCFAVAVLLPFHLQIDHVARHTERYEYHHVVDPCN